MSRLTPMLRQYYDVKAQYPGCIVFFRLGDFYEMFGEDARVASRLLEITLTSRDGGEAGRIPMCGVPHHAADGYIAELVRRGHKVAICEQVEDPKEAKGVVKREVVRVVTPGTLLDDPTLKAKENHYLAAVCRREDRGVRRTGPAGELPLIAEAAVSYGLAVCDLSTGEFSCTQIEGEDALAVLRDELARLRPAELRLDPEFTERAAPEETRIRESVPGVVEADSEWPGLDRARRILLEHFGTHSLSGFGCDDLPLAIRSAAAVLSYLQATQRSRVSQISRLVTYSPREYMTLDAATRRNLELVRTIRTGERKGSLLWVLDRTRTSMGGRLLARWIEQPLIDAEAIRLRLDAVEELAERPELRRRLQERFEAVYDIERLVGKVAFGSANGRDLIALKRSLEALPEVKAALEEQVRSERLSRLGEALDPCEDVTGAIGRALVDDPPVSITEGGLIREGYSAEVDELNTARREGKAWVAALEEKERERTRIKSLKIGFNKVFGYYIEVTRPNLHLVPDDYERKQTLANAERFITPELKEKEAMILGAEDRVIELEYRLFTELRSAVAREAARLQRAAAVVAELDVYCSLAEVALERSYVRPQVDEEDRIAIDGGRHPVVEATSAGRAFVPNDLRLDDSARVIVLTGPNMAGKSTYLRQSALIVLMAQMGSFVPASAAEIGIVDRIFTRVGASDDLATGQSTFMVEMNEVAHILHHATPRSLVILDEVGRGTSTFDGLSIAWAVTEYLHNHEGCRAKTLFATHYHELTELEELLERVRNYSVAVHKEGETIVFLRRIVRGGADQSYGIEVARLAGLPAPVIERAQEILAALESSEEQRLAVEAAAAARLDGDDTSRLRPAQLPLFTEPDPVLNDLAGLDPDRMTPLEALNVLADLVRRVRERGV